MSHQEDCTTIPVGTVVDARLMSISAIAEAIKAALPRHAAIQKTMFSTFEIVDLRKVSK